MIVEVDARIKLLNTAAVGGRWFEVRVGSWFGVLILTAKNGGTVFQAEHIGDCLHFESGCTYFWKVTERQVA